MRFWRKKRDVPTRLEDYYESHPELRLLVREVLLLQGDREGAIHEARRVDDRILVLEGNPDSITGGLLSNKIVALERLVATLNQTAERARLLEEVRGVANG